VALGGEVFFTISWHLLYCTERTVQTGYGYNLSILESTVPLTFGEERGIIHFSCVAKSMAKIS
jgi:hypothetical protein